VCVCVYACMRAYVCFFWGGNRGGHVTNERTTLPLLKPPSYQHKTHQHKNHQPPFSLHRYFADYTVQDFAKAGATAERSVVLQPSEEPLQFFPTSMFNLFRKCVVVVTGCVDSGCLGVDGVCCCVCGGGRAAPPVLSSPPSCSIPTFHDTYNTPKRPPPTTTTPTDPQHTQTTTFHHTTHINTTITTTTHHQQYTTHQHHKHQHQHQH
jgi:hypothetical protein